MVSKDQSNLSGHLNVAHVFRHLMTAVHRGHRNRANCVMPRAGEVVREAEKLLSDKGLGLANWSREQKPSNVLTPLENRSKFIYLIICVKCQMWTVWPLPAGNLQTKIESILVRRGRVDITKHYAKIDMERLLDNKIGPKLKRNSQKQRKNCIPLHRGCKETKLCARRDAFTPAAIFLHLVCVIVCLIVFGPYFLLMKRLHDSQVDWLHHF